MKELFKEIWQERPHVCENCGYSIPKPLAHNFAHIKSKGAYPELKYDKDNIQLLCSNWDYPDDRIGCHWYEHNNPEKFRGRRNGNKSK